MRSLFVRSVRLGVALAIAVGYYAGGGQLRPASADPAASLTFAGVATDGSGPVAGLSVRVLVMEHRTEQEIADLAPQQSIVVGEPVTTGSDGSFAVVVDAEDIPADFIGPDGRIAARVIAGTETTALFQAVDVWAYGPPSDDTTEGASLVSDEPVSQTVEVDGTMIDVVPGTEGASPETGFGPMPQSTVIWGFDYCNDNFETFFWEDIATVRDRMVSTGRVFTRNNTAMSVHWGRSSERRTEAFAVIGGGTARAGVIRSETTDINSTISVPRNWNADLLVNVEYRFHQLVCRNIYDGLRRYPNVGEWYPSRADGGTGWTMRTNEPFACEPRWRTQHIGSQDFNIARGRTRTTSGSFEINGIGGRASLGVTFSDSTTNSTINRLTIDGRAPAGATYYLCGSDDIAVDATFVREK